jgi:CO/xanthine dehydrogenase Mo-binding subunit
MATSNAIGTWLYEYPVTPERVLKSLGEVPQKLKKGPK